MMYISCSEAHQLDPGQVIEVLEGLRREASTELGTLKGHR